MADLPDLSKLSPADLRSNYASLQGFDPPNDSYRLAKAQAVGMFEREMLKRGVPFPASTLVSRRSVPQPAGSRPRADMVQAARPVAMGGKSYHNVDSDGSNPVETDSEGFIESMARTVARMTRGGGVTWP